MNDKNIQLRQAYYERLKGMVKVLMPDNPNSPATIVFLSDGEDGILEDGDGNTVITTLDNIRDIKIYYLFVPTTYDPYYILIQNINNTGSGAKTCELREVTIQVAVCTRLPKNSGWECDKIADKVLELLYPNPKNKIAGTLGTTLISDNTITDYDSESKMQIVERIITFRHFY